MKKRQLQQLEEKYNKWCYQNKVATDVFDFKHEVDKSLDYYEAWEELEEKLKALSESGYVLEKISEVKEKPLPSACANSGYLVNSLFDKPKIIGLCGNANEGKSNSIYWLLDSLDNDFKFNVFTYGLRITFKNTQEIYSVSELEQLKDSLIIVDEMGSLFDLDNRKIKRQVENTLRLIFHNNNILVICGLGENFKKFLSAKLNSVIFKKTTFSDLINGSRIKNILMDYKGVERGSAVLDLAVNEALIYDGKHYQKIGIPYLKKYDSKQENVPIFVRKNVQRKKGVKC